MSTESRPQTLRVFFALWPDARARRALDRCAAALHRACGGRRIRAQNLHLTLAFVGAIEAGRLAVLVGAARAVTPRSFDLVIDEQGYWRHNRIAWLGASQVPEALQQMSADLHAALTAAGVRFDAKPFVAHVTVARNAHPSREPVALAPLRWRADGFALVSSERDEHGPVYRVIEAFRAPD